MVRVPLANHIHGGYLALEIDDTSLLNCLSLGYGLNRPPVNLFMHIDKSSFSDSVKNGIDSYAGVRSILGRDRGSGVYL